MIAVYIFTAIEFVLFISGLRWFLKRHAHNIKLKEVPQKDAFEIMITSAILFLLCADIIARIYELAKLKMG